MWLCHYCLFLGGVGTPGKIRTCGLILGVNMFYPLNYGGYAPPMHKSVLLRNPLCYRVIVVDFMG
jgi:hypothetical protein